MDDRADCANGTCTQPPATCSSDVDCPTGEVCQSGTCVAAGGASDGTPTRTASCTPLAQEKGTAINTTHGRLDGLVTFVVPKGGPSSCNGDSGHIHISVFGTGYSSKNGCHDIHYYNGNDGALVLQPLSASPHVIFFRFATQSF